MAKKTKRAESLPERMTGVFMLALGWCIAIAGCHTAQFARESTPNQTDATLSIAGHDKTAQIDDPSHSDSLQEKTETSSIQLAGYSDSAISTSEDSAVTDTTSPDPDSTFNPLPAMERMAETSNASLLRLQQEAAAAFARTRYISKLPDPTLGTNIFGHPIETAAGSQRANINMMQMIPSLERLNAQEKQACFEAMGLQQRYLAERLRIVADLRTAWFKLYVLQKQIETVLANQELLQSMTDILYGRIGTGRATQGDVLLATLEYSRLEEQLLTLKQQTVSTTANINQLLNRSADTPVQAPKLISVVKPAWTHAMLLNVARENQPTIAAAQLQTQATRWGIEVARLRQRPDISIGAAWYLIDDNRPASPVVDVGRDAWSLGASVTLPLDRTKYQAIRDESFLKHAASHADVDDVVRQYDVHLLDLLQQAVAAADTIELYQTTILPQAKQTFNADQLSLTNSSVEFDRVIMDLRNLLTLEFGFHRAVGQLATSVARIQQATGLDISGEPLVLERPAKTAEP